MAWLKAARNVGAILRAVHKAGVLLFFVVY